MESDVQFAYTHVLSTMPRDASARTGGPVTRNAGAPCYAAQYLQKQEVVATIGIALRANVGNNVTQQLVCNVVSAIEQLQAYAQVYFPGTGSNVRQQQERCQYGVEGHLTGSEAGAF